MQERENDFFIQKNAILSQKPYKANSDIQVKKNILQYCIYEVKILYNNRPSGCWDHSLRVYWIILFESTLENSNSSIHERTSGAS